MTSGEQFFGYFLDDELCGAISLKTDHVVVDIHRLVVHPNHFRKGIAQALLDYIEKTYVSIKIKVATGVNNIPAIRFYLKNGFDQVDQVQIDEQLTLAFFEKVVNS